MNLGENLIFLISQPRAGSTLLQRILGSHPHIHTVAEPWIMLHPLYAFKLDGEYPARWERLAVQGFLQNLPEGEEDYLEGVRRMYGYLYERALHASGKLYFLDKTPLYYLIMPELYRIFPMARYIILFRNPLAVFYSIYRRWAKSNRHLLSNLVGSHSAFKNFLIKAPHLVLKGKEILGEQAVIAHYEQLVKDPETAMQRICRKLEVEFVPEMIDYGGHGLPRWGLGDQEMLYQHTRPVTHSADQWIEALRDPQLWRLLNDYLQWLGRETVNQMGYAYEELHQILESHRPGWPALWLTRSFQRLLQAAEKQRKDGMPPTVFDSRMNYLERGNSSQSIKEP